MLAKAFCASPEFKAAKCGLITEAEGQASVKLQCPLCGTLYRSLPSSLPAEVAGVDRSAHSVCVCRVSACGCVVLCSTRLLLLVVKDPPSTSMTLQHSHMNTATGRRHAVFGVPPSAAICSCQHTAVSCKLLPQTMRVCRYNQYAIDIISLACKGPIVVRSVFQMVDEPAPVKVGLSA